MYKTRIWADFLNDSVEGWTDGTLWNGWATPCFEYREAERIVQLFNNLYPQSAWYDAETDEFCFCLNGEEERYAGVHEEVRGQMRTLYGIGTGFWIWEEAEPNLLCAS